MKKYKDTVAMIVARELSWRLRDECPMNYGHDCPYQRCLVKESKEEESEQVARCWVKWAEIEKKEI